MGIFNTTRLAGNQLLVTGKGKQQTILDTTKWDEIKAELAETDAQDAYDEAVQEFFAPLMEALDAVEMEHGPKVDPAFTIVVSEGTEHVHGEAEVVYNLDTETAIVRMLDEGDTSRLIWVGNDTIAITEMSDED